MLDVRNLNMEIIEMKNDTNVIALRKAEMTFEQRVQNARSHADIEVLFEEQRPGLITVLKKFRVTPMLYQLVAAQLDAIHLNLIVGIEYTPAELMGDADWFQFGHDGQREMELCIKHFAAQKNSKLKDTTRGTFMRA